MKDYTITLLSTVTIPLNEGTLRDPGGDTERMVTAILALHDRKSWEAISQNTLLKNPASVHLNTMAISNSLFTEPDQSSKVHSLDGSGEATIATLCLKEFVSLLKGFKDASGRAFAIRHLFRELKNHSYEQQACDEDPSTNVISLDPNLTPPEQEEKVQDYTPQSINSYGRQDDASG